MNGNNKKIISVNELKSLVMQALDDFKEVSKRRINNA